MSIKVLGRHLMPISPFLFFTSYVYAFQTTPAEQIKGAIVQFRIYELAADDTTTELGTKTAYLSSNGNWTTIKRNVHGATEQTLIADANRAGVFLVNSDDTAAKMSDFLPDTKAISKSQYKKYPQFQGEVTFLGYKAYLERHENNGKVISEFTWIPFLRQPVKIVNFQDDGSKTVEEAVSVELREPEADRVKLPDKVIVTTDASEQFKPRRKAGEKPHE